MKAYRRHRQIRRIHFHDETCGEEVWTYRVSSSFVTIRDPNKRTTLVTIEGVSGSYDEYPTPQMVKDYIWKNLKPGRVLKTNPQSPDEAKESVLNFFLGARGRQFDTYYDKDGNRRIVKFAGVQK